MHVIVVSNVRLIVYLLRINESFEVEIIWDEFGIVHR